MIFNMKVYDLSNSRSLIISKYELSSVGADNTIQSITHYDVDMNNAKSIQNIISNKFTIDLLVFAKKYNLLKNTIGNNKLISEIYMQSFKSRAA